MKNALLIVLFAVVAFAGIRVASAEVCPGNLLCQKVDVQSADGAIGSPLNTATKIGTCYLTPLASAGVTTSYWALRRYASVATGSITRAHVYPVALTTATQAIPIFDVFPNGAYGDNVTGAVIARCGYSK